MKADIDAAAKANSRITLIFWVSIILGGAAMLQLFNLQVLQYTFFREKAQKMHLTTIKQQIGRGTIFDRRGKKLAESIKTNSIYICPRDITEKNKAADALCRDLGVPLDFVLKKMRSRSFFEYIKRKVDGEAAEKLLSRNIKGIYTQIEEKRYYPIADAAVHVIGVSGMDNKGLEGLELQCEKYLKGKTGRLQIRRDAKQRPIMIDTVDIKKAEKGADIHLTIDTNMQYTAKEELARTVQKYNGIGGSIIVMDPSTGAIYALANYPAYDPNTMDGYNRENRRNRAVTDMYEPGSTFKIFTMAAYLEAFPDGEKQKVFCGNGQQEFFGRIVHDHEKYGWLTVPEVIKYSSNIGMVDIAMKVPQEKIYDEFIKFGFGKKTNTDMPDETAGMLRNYREWDNTTLTSIPYGQEVAITPVQLMRAYAAIANGGYLVTPHVIDRIEKNGSVLYSAPSGKGQKIIGDREREKMVSMLKLVTEKDGSGKKAAIAGYSVAGKTGTAQKHNKKGKGYAAGKYVASFIGFLPADKPEVLTLVVIDEPRPVYYGSEVAAPAFKNVNSMVITGMHVAPQESTVAEAGAPAGADESKMPDFYMTDFPRVKAFFTANNIKFSRYGFGRSVIGQKPEAGKMVKNGDQVYVLLGDKDKTSGVRVYMPDVRGMSIRKALEILGAMGIKAKCSGSGYAVTQEPKPGIAVQKGSVCTINFEMKDAT